MKRLILVLLVCLALAACDLPTATPTEPGTETPTVTLSPSPSPTYTATPDESPTVTPTHEPVLSLNLIDHAGFEGIYRPVVYGEVNVEENWLPFYIEGIPSDEPDQPLLGRPEYKPIDAINYPERVHGGNLAQTWFCFFRPCRAGVYRTFEVLPGYQYLFKIWVQSWSNFDDDVESELDTEDNRAASQWTIKIDPLGGENPDAVAMIACYLGGVAHYDNWVEFSCEFTADTNRATVFIENTRPWGLQNQDSYVDDAFLGCYDCPDAPFYTPTPIAKPGPSPTPIPRTLDPAVKLFPFAMYESDNNMVIRSNHSVNSTALGTLPANTQRFTYARWAAVNGDIWACIDENWDIVDHPDYDWLSILACDQWVAVYINSTLYGTISEAVPIDGGGIEAQGIEKESLVQIGEYEMELEQVLEIVFAILAVVPVFVGGSLLGNAVSAVVDLVKAIIHALGKELPDEWAGRVFLIVNFVAFVVIFAVTGVNPAEYVLPDQAAEILALAVNIVVAITGLLGALAFGDLVHKLAKKFAPLWVSGTARSQGKA